MLGFVDPTRAKGCISAEGWGAASAAMPYPDFYQFRVHVLKFGGCGIPYLWQVFASLGGRIFDRRRPCAPRVSNHFMEGPAWLFFLYSWTNDDSPADTLAGISRRDLTSFIAAVSRVAPMTAEVGWLVRLFMEVNADPELLGRALTIEEHETAYKALSYLLQQANAAWQVKGLLSAPTN